MKSYPQQEPWPHGPPPARKHGHYSEPLQRLPHFCIMWPESQLWSSSRYQSSMPDVILWNWGWASGVHSCRWWGHLHNLGPGWVHWGKRGEEHDNFLSSCLKSLSLGVQEGIVALTFFSRRRVAACQGQLQAAHLHFAGSLWSERDTLPFLRSSASLEAGPLPHTDCYSPFNLFPTPPSSWLTLTV